MDDRELLELAAKAADVELKYDSFGLSANSDREYNYWNPLIDDSDALRLAVKLGLQMYIFLADDDIGISNTQVNRRFTEHHTNDPYAATRRAIVRAAAAIGKEMK